MKSYLNKKNIDKVFENYYERPFWITKEDCAVDIDISYDKSRKNIFIFSHAFNDAVRYSNNIIFSDYYIWLEETLDTENLSSESISVFHIVISLFKFTAAFINIAFVYIMALTIISVMPLFFKMCFDL